MNEAVLDTDIFSEVLKGRNTNVRSRVESYQAVYDRLAITILSVVELVRGLHKVGREDRVVDLVETLTKIEVLGMQNEAAVLAGRIDADLERTGQSVGRADPMIAAIAIHHERTLITGNTDHFDRIVKLGYGLKLDNWRI